MEIIKKIIDTLADDSWDDIVAIAGRNTRVKIFYDLSERFARIDADICDSVSEMLDD